MIFDDIFEGIADKIGDIKFAITFAQDQAELEREQKRDKQREQLNEVRYSLESLTEDTPLGPLVKSANALYDKAENIHETIENASHSYSGTKITDISDLKEGDHLYIDKGLYSHHGLYLGFNEVMHFASNEGDILIHRTPLETFKDGHALYRLSKSDSPVIYDDCVIIARALQKEGLSGYDLFSNNCENFVRWCRNGSIE